MKFIVYLGWITLGFIIYAECSVGNILFRTNSKGNLSVNIGSLLNFMWHPLTHSTLWTFSTLDINYPFVILCASLVYYLFY